MIDLLEYKEYFKNKKEEDIKYYEEALYGYNFIRKYNEINYLLKSIFNDTKVTFPYGDYTSKIMIITDNEDEEITNLLKSVLSRVTNYDLSEIYVTCYKKTNADRSLLRVILNKEINIIKPKLIINLSSLDGVSIESKCDIYSIENERIKLLSDFNSGRFKEEEKEEIKKTGIDLWSILYNIESYTNDIKGS